MSSIFGNAQGMQSAVVTLQQGCRPEMVNTYCGTRNKKLVLGKKSGLVEFSRASRFSRSLARLASG